MKKATIVVSLVEECSHVTNCDIEEEIKRELAKNLFIIPWAKEIERVTIE